MINSRDLKNKDEKAVKIKVNKLNNIKNVHFLPVHKHTYLELILGLVAYQSYGYMLCLPTDP